MSAHISDALDFMRCAQSAQTDFFLQLLHLLRMNDLLLIGLNEAFPQSQWLSSQAFDALKNIKAPEL